MTILTTMVISLPERFGKWVIFSISDGLVFLAPSLESEELLDEDSLLELSLSDELELNRYHHNNSKA